MEEIYFCVAGIFVYIWRYFGVVCDEVVTWVERNLRKSSVVMVLRHQANQEL